MDKPLDAFPLDAIPGLPYSLEAEQSVLGCALLDRTCLTTAMEKLKEEAFYFPLHKKLFATIKRQFDLGKPADLIIVLEAAAPEVDMASAELREYLLKLCQIVPTVSNLASYIKIVSDKYYLRSLYSASKETIDNVMDASADADVVLERAEQRIYEIRQGRDNKGLVPLKTTLVGVFDEIKVLSELKKDIRGISCGFTDLDRKLSGLNKSDMLVLAARPGVGKSAFAINMARNVAGSTKGSVAIFTLEMSKEQVAQRLISSESGIDLSRILTGQLTSDEWTRFWSASGVLSNLNILIDDTAGITVSEIKARLRQVPDLRLAVIDYLQLMSSSRRIENRVNEVSEMTRAVKIMAKELNVPILILSQLSRATEKRGEKEKRPMLSDLRESGSIEQDADVVMFLYREDYYNREAAAGNTAECIIAKNRHGENGTVNLHWQGSCTRFTSAAYQQDNEAQSN